MAKTSSPIVKVVPARVSILTNPFGDGPDTRRETDGYAVLRDGVVVYSSRRKTACQKFAKLLRQG